MGLNMVQNSLRLRAVIVSCLLGCATMTGVQAQVTQVPNMPTFGARADAQSNEGLRFGMDAGLIHSDNANRVSSNERSGEIGQLGVQFGYQERTRRIDTSVSGNLAYQHYFDGTFDNDVVGRADGLLAVQILPERLRWLFEDNFGQVTSDPFEAPTPTNRENINYFTTGPELLMHLGGANSLLLSGHYSDASYEVTNLDSQRYGGAVALQRALSGASDLSLNLTGESVSFDDTTMNTDYDRYQAFLRYELRGARTKVALDGGATRIDRANESSNGLLARLTFTRMLSNASSLWFHAGSQLSDSGDLFRSDQDRQGGTPNSPSVIGSSDVFKSRFVGAGWSFTRNRTSLGVSGEFSTERYERSSNLDRNLTTVGARVERQISRLTQLRVYANWEREKFSNIVFTDDELQAGISIERKLSRLFGLRLQYDYFDRDSSNGTSKYQENRVGLFLTWSPVARP